MIGVKGGSNDDRMLSAVEAQRIKNILELADILNGKISNESPVGERLIGSKTGQIVTVETPNGTKNFKITNFWRE